MFSKLSKSSLRASSIRCFSTSTKIGQKSMSSLTELDENFLSPESFYKGLLNKNMKFFTGVPDSLLKDFCGYVTDHTPERNHVIAANEGTAVAIATGHYLATKRFPLVYLQNSGLGNIVNPILSLASSKVYSIPMLLLIGWRGEPGRKDEPQHMVQGRVMNGLLTEMGISYQVLPDYDEGAEEALDEAFLHMQRRQNPYALLVRKGTFSKYELQNSVKHDLPLLREEALELMLPMMGPHDVIVGTTGFLSRELYEIRDRREQDHSSDFLCVGSMGHASSIATGISIAKPSRKIYCFDGDGAALMHLGSLGISGCLDLPNFKHVLFNNGAHDSVGGQPTVGFGVNFASAAAACGYQTVLTATTKEEVVEGFKKLAAVDGPAFLEIKVRAGVRSDLGRPKITPKEQKMAFMEYLDL